MNFRDLFFLQKSNFVCNRIKFKVEIVTHQTPWYPFSGMERLGMKTTDIFTPTRIEYLNNSCGTLSYTFHGSDYGPRSIRQLLTITIDNTKNKKISTTPPRDVVKDTGWGWG